MLGILFTKRLYDNEGDQSEMIENYFLLICVSLEQEIAIRELFEARAWAYKQVRKYQEGSVHVESATQTIWKETITLDDITETTITEIQHLHKSHTDNHLDDVTKDTQTGDNTPNETVQTGFYHQDYTPQNLDTRYDVSKDTQTGDAKGIDDTQKDTLTEIQYQDYITQDVDTEEMKHREPHSNEYLATTGPSNIIQNQPDKCASNRENKRFKPKSIDTKSLIQCDSFDKSRGVANTADGEEAGIIKQSYDSSIASEGNNSVLTLASPRESDVKPNMKKENNIIKTYNKTKPETDHLGSYEISPETSKVAFKGEINTVEPFKAKVLKNICSLNNDSSEKTVRNTKLRPTSLRHKSAAYKRNTGKDCNKSKFQKNDQPINSLKKPISGSSQMKIQRRSVKDQSKVYVMLQRKEKSKNTTSNKTKKNSIIDSKSARISESDTAPKHKIDGKSHQSNRSVIHNTAPVKGFKTIQLKSCEGIAKKELRGNGKLVDRALNSLELGNALMSQIDSLSGDVKAKVLEVFKSATADTKVTNSFECFYCHRLFSKKTHFVKHIQRHTKCEFDCPECGKKFKNYRNMNAHRFQRSSRKKFSCDICDHEANTACLLRIHKKSTHPASDTFFCHLCPKVIRTKSYLNMHLKLTHGIDDGKYECHICGKKSKRPKLFQKHLETHKNSSDERQCQTCEKIFKSKRHLRSHMRVHEERKHVCSECGKSFTTVTKLAGHKRTHSGDKPFQCTQCDYKSTQAGNLRSHMKVHQRYGENKGDSTKPKSKTTHDDTAEDMKSNTDPVYGPMNDHHGWYNKQSYHQTRTPTVESSEGHPGQSMMYSDQGQANHHYGDDIGCQGDHRYGDQMNFNGPKDVPVNPGSDSQSHMSGMFAGGMGEQGNRYQGMVYNHMEGYADTYSNNQYYNSMDTASYIVQSDNTVTNNGRIDVMADNSMKPYTVSNTEPVPNIHGIYQQQSSQTMQQHNYLPHLHHHHQQPQQNLQQHQPYQQQQPLQEHHQQQQQVMYPLAGTGESVKAHHTNDGHSLYGDSQCYTDLGEHSSTTNYPNPNTLDSNVCHNDGQNKSYSTDLSKSNFTNPNVRIFLGSESGLDSLNYAPYPAVDQAISVPYGDNVHQQGYGDRLQDQETYTELQRTGFPNVPTSEMS